MDDGTNLTELQGGAMVRGVWAMGQRRRQLDGQLGGVVSQSAAK
jgi:hypothetical protein